jgi:hypothetical protein
MQTSGHVTGRIAFVEPLGSPFPQVTVSLIDSDAIDPCEQGAAVIESVNREVHLGEDVLSNVFGVSPVIQYSVYPQRQIHVIGSPPSDRLLAAKCAVSDRWSL